MARLSIEITDDEHRKLKAIAALSGLSIKDYVLDRTLPEISSKADTQETFAKLCAFLETRMDQAASGDFSTLSFDEIRDKAKKRVDL
ncbi:hypothetical protein A8B75_17225 [Sphingomonadales bacterium EhC05]|nr:hypothetical protein A8B75_17225 [Sphingomonadales bacterium EhC05]